MTSFVRRGWIHPCDVVERMARLVREVLEENQPKSQGKPPRLVTCGRFHRAGHNPRTDGFNSARETGACRGHPLFMSMSRHDILLWLRRASPSAVLRTWLRRCISLEIAHASVLRFAIPCSLRLCCLALKAKTKALIGPKIAWSFSPLMTTPVRVK